MNEKTFHSRRRFLAALTAAACASGFTGAMRSAVAKEAAGGKSPVRWVPGMELYTLGLKPTDDIAAAFKALAALGYREVEFSGHYDRSFAELKRALDGAGLAGPALHALPRPAKGAWDLTGDLPKFAADAKTLGVSFVVVSIPLLPDRIYDVLQNPPKGFDVAAASRLFASLEADDWKRTADLLNAKGAVLAKHGLRLAYHNHGMDFLALPGDTNGFRLLVERTDPKLVSFELDRAGTATAVPPARRAHSAAAPQGHQTSVDLGHGARLDRCRHGHREVERGRRLRPPRPCRAHVRRTGRTVSDHANGRGEDRL